MIGRGMVLATQSYFKNLLVAADGSSYSLQAEETAANLAKAFNSKVTVLHVRARKVRCARYFTRLLPKIVLYVKIARASLSNRSCHTPQQETQQKPTPGHTSNSNDVAQQQVSETTEDPTQ